MSEFILSYWEGIEGGLGVKQEERCGFNIYWQIRDYVYAGVITGFVHNHNNQIVKNLNHMFFFSLPKQEKCHPVYFIFA